MLWYKGWLETRYRLVFLFVFIVFVVSIQGWARKAGSNPPNSAAVLSSFYTLVPLETVIIAAFLGAAGIATQPSLGVSKGLHGSTLFTLALPVKRANLMLTRVAIGWLETVLALTIFFCGVWYRSSALRLVTTSTAVAHYALTVAVCGTAFYCVAVLLGSFLDDQWRTWATMLVAGVLAWASSQHLLPGSLDLFGAMGKASPLFGNPMPWGPMALSLIASVVLLGVTLKIVERREY